METTMSDEKTTEAVAASVIETEAVPTVSDTPKSVAPVKKSKAKKATPVKASTAQKTKQKTTKAKSTPNRRVEEKATLPQAKSLTPAAKEPVSETVVGLDGALDFGRNNFDAFIAANTSFVQGMQDINTEVLSIVQSCFEDNANVSKKILACSSVEEVVSLQNELVKESVSSAIQQGQALSNLSVKVIEDSAAPLAERVNVTVEALTKPIAA
jgi:phasin family protein